MKADNYLLLIFDIRPSSGAAVDEVALRRKKACSREKNYADYITGAVVFFLYLVRDYCVSGIVQGQ